MAKINAPAAGEAGILAMIRRATAADKSSRLVLGPGDDCAIIRPAAGKLLALTTDEMAEGTHFVNPADKAALIARKLLRINLSDLAAMGAVKPVCALCGAAFPRGMGAAWIKKFTNALAAECRCFGVSLAGGNLSRAKSVHVYIALIGEIAAGKAVLRSGAKPGDLIFALGPLGEAKAGLELDMRGGAAPAEFKRLVKSFWLPEPLLAEGSLIGRYGLASAMMDNSDGLYKSVITLAEESGCGAVIELSPGCRSAALGAYCAKFRRDWRAYALEGGEDYGLVAAVPGRKAAKFLKIFPRARHVGRMTAKRAVKVQNGPKIKAFEHF